MKILSRVLGSILLAALVQTGVRADSLVTFDFDGAAGNEATLNAAFVATGIAAPVTISRGAGLTATANAGRFNAQGWGETSAANALANGDYFEWTITPDGGSSISITQIAFNVQRSNTGASNLVLRTSADGYVADLGTLTGIAGNNATARSTNDTSGVAGLQGLTGPVTMRVIGWTGVSGGSMGFEGPGDDIVISGIVNAGPPPTNVHFAAASASVGEDSGTYTVTIVKTVADGNVSGTIALGGTAVEGTDYDIDTTSFTMNGATTSATFEVTIYDNGDEDGNRDVTLTIDSVTGGDAVSPDVFTLTITDDEAPEPPAGGLLISQYTDTESGTAPKGIEIWNNTGAAITFDGSANLLDVKVGVNGGAPASSVQVNSGTLAAGAVLVIGTSDMSPDVVKAFTFNGDDAIVLEFGGVVVDMIGTAGVDPGAAWTGNGVSTADQNIQLKAGITTGAPTGWSDPSDRFEKVGVGSDLTGFGIAPGGVAPNKVQFTAASDSASEAAGTYTVTIIKTKDQDNVSGTIALSGTAVESTDYTIDTQSYTLNGATTSATFTITLNDDAVYTGSRTVLLTIDSVTGATIGSPSVFTLTITDDDVPSAEGIADYRFGASDAVAVDATAAGITASDMGATAGTVKTGEAGSWANGYYAQLTGGWTNDNQAQAKAFQFTITPDAGKSVTITQIAFVAYATAAGPSALGFDINGGAATYAANLTNVVALTVVEPVSGVVAVEDPITILIQGWTNGTRTTAGGGDFRIDDVVVFGTVDNVGGGGSYSPEQEDYINDHWGSVGAYEADGGDEGDSDGDGYSNVEEYIAGTDPVPPNGDQSFFEARAISGSGTRLITVESAVDRVYRLWSSSTLAPTQDWQPVGSPLPGNGGNLSLGDNSLSNSASYRVTVELTPVP